MSNELILGLDISTKTIGIALFEDENKATLFENKLGRWERKARAIDSQQYPSRGLPNGSYVITGVRS